MWEPDPSWRRLPGAGGPSTAGIWLAEVDGRRWVVKRLTSPEQPAGVLTDPTYAGYWRREAEVAKDPAVVDGPGLVPAEFGPVEEDEDGITVWSLEQEGEPPNGLLVARALGRFAGATHSTPPWASRRLLADRLAMAEERNGWPTLARTTLADVADELWRRREHWLNRSAQAPEGRLHGDAVPGNFLTTRAHDVVAVDWQCFGVGPVGTDVGYYASLEPRGLRGPAGCVPRRGGRGRGPRGDHARCTGHGRLHRAHSCRVGACAGGPGRRCPGREVPASRCGAVHPRGAAAVPADRVAGAGPRLTPQPAGATASGVRGPLRAFVVTIAMVLSGCGGGEESGSGSGDAKDEPSATPAASYFVKADTDAIERCVGAGAEGRRAGAVGQGEGGLQQGRRSRLRGVADVLAQGAEPPRERAQRPGHPAADPLRSRLLQGLRGCAAGGTGGVRDLRGCGRRAAFRDRQQAPGDAGTDAADLRRVAGGDLQGVRRAVPGGRAGLLLAGGPRQDPGELAVPARSD